MGVSKSWIDWVTELNLNSTYGPTASQLLLLFWEDGSYFLFLHVSQLFTENWTFCIMYFSNSEFWFFPPWGYYICIFFLLTCLVFICEIWNVSGLLVSLLSLFLNIHIYIEREKFSFFNYIFTWLHQDLVAAYRIFVAQGFSSCSLWVQ